jgi:hypothetical protein
LKTSSSAVYQLLIAFAKDVKFAESACEFLEKDHEKPELHKVCEKIKQIDKACEKYFYENRTLQTKEDFIRLFEFILPIYTYCGEIRGIFQKIRLTFR